MHKPRLRALFTVFAFLAIVALLIAAGTPDWLHTTLLILIWGGLLVGSAALLTKTVRSGSANSYGQLGALPRAWRRWFLDEPNRDC